MSTNDVQVSLYNGLHKVEYYDERHIYKVNGKIKKGVTTIIGKVLAKNGLALWPMNMALKYIKDNFSLINMGELDFYTYLEKICREASKAHEVARDKGANTGTLVHELAESILKDEQIVDLLEYPEEVVLAIEGLEHWLSVNVPDVIAVENIVYSAELDYTGKFDSILKLNGKNYLVDLKTTNISRDAPQGIYPEYFIQLGAYAKAYLEEFQYEDEEGITDNLVPIDDLMVLSCRKDGKVDTLTASELGLSVQDCIKMWENVYNLYIKLEDISNKIRKRV